MMSGDLKLLVEQLLKSPADRVLVRAVADEYMDCTNCGPWVARRFALALARTSALTRLVMLWQKRLTFIRPGTVRWVARDTIAAALGLSYWHALNIHLLPSGVPPRLLPNWSPKAEPLAVGPYVEVWVGAMWLERRLKSFRRRIRSSATERARSRFPRGNGSGDLTAG